MVRVAGGVVQVIHHDGRNRRRGDDKVVNRKAAQIAVSRRPVKAKEETMDGMHQLV